MAATPTPAWTHISLYAKASTRDAENPRSKMAQPGFLPMFEREERIHIGLERYSTVPLGLLPDLSLISLSCNHDLSNIWYFHVKKDYRSSGHTAKCINCHYPKLQRNFYTFVELKLQKTNCFNISNEIFERTTFFLLV